MDVYHNDEKVISGTSLKETKKSTTTLLRTILVLTQVISLLVLKPTLWGFLNQRNCCLNYQSKGTLTDHCKF